MSRLLSDKLRSRKITISMMCVWEIDSPLTKALKATRVSLIRGDYVERSPQHDDGLKNKKPQQIKAILKLYAGPRTVSRLSE